MSSRHDYRRRDRGEGRDRDRDRERDRHGRGGAPARRSRSRSPPPRASDRRDYGRGRGDDRRERDRRDDRRRDDRDRRDHDRDRDGRREPPPRDRERERDVDRDRERGPRSGDRPHERDGRSEDKAATPQVDSQPGGSRSAPTKSEEPPDTRSRQESEVPTEGGEEGEAMDATNEDDAAMMAIMGMTGFGTTKGKQVEGNQEGSVQIKKMRTWRQYMNRRGGFNRPLDKIK